jgi:hypothetical protein
VATLAFTQPEPGIYVVQYFSPADLAPALQQPLIAALVESAKQSRPTGVIFSLQSSIRGIDMDVPTFWLSVTTRSDTGLKAMAIVTTSAAVRVAASGFALANRVRGLTLEVKTFPTEDVALTWIRGLLRAT